MKYIGLLDCNNFFVSCERLFRPDLQNKPTLVLSSNDGCVVARSQEVKALGIPMGVPYFQVKKELTEANVAIFSGNITLYRDISARVMSILKREFVVVEQYSVDESFFGIDAENDEEVLRILADIKQKVEKEVGVPVSIGAGATKTIAKYAGEKEKRGIGVCVLTGENWENEQENIPIQKIWGVGGKTERKMRSLGVTTVQAFVQINTERISTLFGVMGTRLRGELTEQVTHSLGAKKELQKSIMSTRSFKKTTLDLAVLQDAVSYHISHASEELRSIGAVAQGLRVIMQPSRHGDWMLHNVSVEIVLPSPTDDTLIFLKEAMQAVEQSQEEEVPYKKVGVVLSMLTTSGNVQASLFDVPEVQTGDNKIMMNTLDVLNERFGKGTIAIGRHTLKNEWGSHKSHISPKYTTEWSEIASVKA